METDSNRFTLSDYADVIDYDGVSNSASSSQQARVVAGPSSAHRPLPRLPMSPTELLGPGPKPYPKSSPQLSPTIMESSPPRAPPGITYPPRARTESEFAESGFARQQQDYFTARPSPSGMLSPSGEASRQGSMSPNSVLMSPCSTTMSPGMSSAYGPMSPRSGFSGYSEKVEEPVPAPASETEFAPRPVVKISMKERLFPKSWPCRLLIIVVFLEAVIDIAVQANLLWRFNKEQEWAALGGDWIEQRRLPYFVGIFTAAHLVQFALTVYAVYTRNMIQVFGLAIFNALLLIYASFQIGEITTILGSAPDLETHKIFTLPTKILSGLVIGTIALAQIIIAVLSWFIWKEFGWRIYRFLGADLHIRRYYFQYQIFECIVCFSFFFFAGFGVQFIGMVLNKTDPEFIITIVMLPVSLLWLVIGILAARREYAWLMSVFLVGLLGGIAYFVYKFVRIFTAAERYTGVQKSLGVFCMLSLVMIILCLVYGCIVWRNFGKGLKQAVQGGKKKNHKSRRRAAGEERGDEFAELGSVTSPAAKKAYRVTID